MAPSKWGDKPYTKIKEDFGLETQLTEFEAGYRQGFLAGMKQVTITEEYIFGVAVLSAFDQFYQRSKEV